MWMTTVLFIVGVVLFVATAFVTLRGITGKAQIKGLYLGPLVAGLLVENAGAVVYMFRTIDVSATSASRFIASLPEQVRAANPAASRDKIREMVEAANELREDTATVAELRSQVNELTGEKVAADARILQLEAEAEASGRHFLVRLVRFHRDASEFGNSLNFTYPPHPRKAELARRFLALLAEIGHHTRTCLCRAAPTGQACSRCRGARRVGRALVLVSQRNALFHGRLRCDRVSGECYARSDARTGHG